MGGQPLMSTGCVSVSWADVDQPVPGGRGVRRRVSGWLPINDLLTTVESTLKRSYRTVSMLVTGNWRRAPLDLNQPRTMESVGVCAAQESVASRSWGEQSEIGAERLLATAAGKIAPVVPVTWRVVTL